MTCRHFGVCGGCSVPGVPYAEQLREKRRRLATWFPDVDVPPLVASPAEGAYAHERHDVRVIDGPDVPKLLDDLGLRVTTMGRGPAEDPLFFRAAAAAGALAAAHL